MQKNIIVGIILIIIFGGIGLYALQSKEAAAPVTSTTTGVSPITTTTTVPSTQTTTSTGAKTPVITAAAKGNNAAITKVTLGTTLNADGSVSGVKTTFVPTTKNIYAGLAVKNVTVRTQFAYIRLFNGKYVDSKVSHPSKDGVQYFHFAWTLVPGQVRKSGTYSLDFYVNGKKAQTVTYIVK